MTVRPGPRRLGAAVRSVQSEAAPRTLLAAVQEAWPRVAGAGVAAQAEPVSERDRVVGMACRSATWAQELDLLQDELLARLNEALVDTPGGPLEALRFSADAARHTDTP